jgi:nitroimidazol reductase NimA-like FMN-containing flavoprotein (pyridoxamine 5'-phosphate oxidase superfamily)
VSHLGNRVDRGKIIIRIGDIGMPDIKSPDERAVEVMLANKYLALATMDAHGPWAAGIAHGIVPPNHIGFLSYLDSRHIKAIVEDPRVAGVIFDSRASTEEVESIQFSGIATLDQSEETIRRLFKYSAMRTKEAMVPDETILKHASQDDPVLVMIEVERMYVLDQHQYENSGKDGREPVDLMAVFKSYFDRIS